MACAGAVWYIAGWPYAVVTLGLWLVMIPFQLWLTKAQKRLKADEALKNDERMKLLSEMVMGIDTIKAYAWEEHYGNKVKEVR